MKERYLDIMSRVVDVYSPERVESYINKNRTEGVREHGFPRLCANIGILMAHGRKPELKERFEEMMELCCRDMPDCSKALRGNDFSVREILSCILELEDAGLYPQHTIDRWKQAMAAIDPASCYRAVAPIPPVPMDNWAAFNAAGEQLRCKTSLADTCAFVENQIASQMFSFDRNGMYRDPHDPMVYDLVGRNMLAACLFYGYKGTYKEQLDANLQKAAELTLLMQSVTGELPYGGRSNQFIHNEAHLAVCFEYEAMRRKQLGQTGEASRFKAGANLALDTIEYWLDIAPGQHIKNYFPIDSKIGCEKYAYYDKYMITVASFLYMAYQYCDDGILPSTCPAQEDDSYSWTSSQAFHKLFCKSGPYFLEAELAADPNYDASGIGRIHRRGAPPAICISVSASVAPNYTIEAPNPIPLSICCGAPSDGSWEYGSDINAVCTLCEHHADSSGAFATLHCQLPSGKELTQQITVSQTGVDIEVSGNGTVGLLLPAFRFDGKTYTNIVHEKNTLTVRYQNWICRYESNGQILDTEMTCTNRNGHYRVFRAESPDKLSVHIQIDPI